MHTVVLKTKREKSLVRLHPWVFSGAVERVDGNPTPGETIDVMSAADKFLARGSYSPASQIRVRVWTFDAAEEIGPAFFRARLEQAIAARSGMVDGSGTTAYRLVNAESDRLPGVVVDRYDHFLVCQFTSAGAEQWKRAIAEELAALVPCDGVYDRSDVGEREKEGLSPSTGVLVGSEPPELIEIRENNMRFLVDVRRGHKTGFYLDQRENRSAIASYVPDRDVLNCFAYTGGFSVVALKAGARQVTNVESSATVLELARRNAELNQVDTSRLENVEGDVFRVLRTYCDSRRRFDVIVLDPPKFAESRAGLDRACRGYKDINLLAFKLLRPGGILCTFSCSGLLEPDLFTKVVADAALDAHRTAQIVRRLGQPSDHPVLLSFPEGAYLKGLVCRVQ